MNENPGNWFESALGLVIGLDDTMTIGDILAIAAIVLIIVIPIVMPFSFYRIKPLMQELSDRAMERDRALLEEVQKIAPRLRQIADATAASNRALLDEFRKITSPLDEAVKRQEDDDN